MHQHPLLRLIGPLFVALIVLPLGFAPPQPSAAATLSQSESAPSPQAAMNETEPNDTIAQARLKRYDPTNSSWTLEISGALSSSNDIDYFAFNLAEPASQVQITLDNLPADYDLILASGPEAAFEQGSSGIDDITNVGGQIASIGGQIASIGGQIASIGGQIASIGGQIASIGGQIASISANPGGASESIDTFLWQPGTYYVAVGAANGAYSSSPYRLTVKVTGSSLVKPSVDPPTIEMRATPPTYNGLNPITTLYVISPSRMAQIYGSTQIAPLISTLGALAESGISRDGRTEYGYVLDLDKLKTIAGGTSAIDPLYTLWLSNQGNPFYANLLARTIDNLIKAASDPDRVGGTSCVANLPAAATPCPAATVYYDTGAPNADAPFPDVKYIVLVGGDDVLPFFRTPDLTTIANEADYATYLKSIDSGGVIKSPSPQSAALKYRMTLSDNPYGSDKPLRFQGFPLFVPNRAVGRLVETPDDILRYLNHWSNRANYWGLGYTIDLRSGEGITPQAYVNGYDFLTDQAQAVSQTLQSGLSYTPTLSVANIGGPINDGWRRAELESSWFEGDLTATPYTVTQGIFSDSLLNEASFSHPNELFSLNSHFDHWQILPAVGADTANGTFPAQRVYKPNYASDLYYVGGYFGGTLGYSVGCHSGYNVLDKAINFAEGSDDYNLYRADFAQAFVRQAGSWIGNTGYGYGTADGIDYSERLSLLLTQELLRDVRTLNALNGGYNYVGAPIGTALMRAKQRYIRNVVGMSAYDAKALTIMTLYGLPFINVLVDSPLAPPPEEQQFRGSAAIDAPSQDNAPIGANSNGMLERTITVRIDLPDPQTVDRTKSKRIIPAEEDFSVTDSFVQAGFTAPKVRLIENNQLGLPNLPSFAYDISALNSAGSERLKVRDVVFVRGKYDAAVTFNPQITQIVTETDSPISGTGAEPSFAAGAGIWYPDKFFAFSSVGQGDEQRDQLISTVAQFKADANGVTGQLRGYSEMVFTVYYVDPQAAPQDIADDETAPSIRSVQIEGLSTVAAQSAALATVNSVKVVAIIEKGDGANMAGVSGVYVKDGTEWTPVTFVNKSAPDDAVQRWEATINLPPGEVRAIISATDAAGNVSYYTAKGTFNIGGSQVYLPLLRR